MELPSEDSSLSKPNLSISLNLNGENKSLVNSDEKSHGDAGEWLGLVPSVRDSQHFLSITGDTYQAGSNSCVMGKQMGDMGLPE